MSSFFHALDDNNLLKDWVYILDWIFDDDRFPKSKNWNGGYVSLYTKRMKKIKGISGEGKHYQYGGRTELSFPDRFEKKQMPYIVISKGDGEARDLIRHIRNGIAHGITTQYKVLNEPYIEILDFQDKTRKKDKQTAYISVPLSLIKDLYVLYIDIEKSIEHAKAKDRRSRQELTLAH